ncbi:Proteasome subunit [Operophtera brumata]|uniref:Proteasome subunit n=1 Tax=Operophtera brumata TaxID=104452 RepID=A0A0L7LUS9_OPEBR|nr:Proteasome subunit [Operophtera brumata]
MLLQTETIEPVVELLNLDTVTPLEDISELNDDELFQDCDSEDSREQEIVREEILQPVRQETKSNEEIESNAEPKINNLAAIHQDLSIQLSGDEEPSRKRRRMEPSGEMSGDLHIDKSEGPTSFLPCNKKLDDLIHLVKPHIQQWVEDFNLLRMWINILLPTLENEAGLQLSIQKRALDKINRPDKDAAEILNNISTYFLLRADILIDYKKNIEGYTRAVRELDEKLYLSLRRAICRIRTSTVHFIMR